MSFLAHALVGLLPTGYQGNGVRADNVVYQRCYNWQNAAALGVRHKPNTAIVMNILTLLAVLATWLPFGASTAQTLYAVVVLIGIGTGSFIPLGGNKLVPLPMMRFIVCI